MNQQVHGAPLAAKSLVNIGGEIPENIRAVNYPERPDVCVHQSVFYKY